MERIAYCLFALFLATRPASAGELKESRMTLAGFADELVVDHPVDWTTDLTGPEDHPTLRIDAPSSSRVRLLLTSFPMPPGSDIDSARVAFLLTATERLAGPTHDSLETPVVEVRGPAAWGSFVKRVDPHQTDALAVKRTGMMVVDETFLLGFTLFSDEAADEDVQRALGILRSARCERILPDAPVGFEWVELEAVRGAFVKPHGWHDRLFEDGERLRYTLSRESTGADGGFSTGLAIEVLRNASAATGRLAPNAARALVASAVRAERIETLDSWSSEVSRMQLFGAHLRETGDGQSPRIRRLLAIGNPDTDTLYVLEFTSPEKLWIERDSEIADTMLHRFLLDTEI